MANQVAEFQGPLSPPISKTEYFGQRSDDVRFPYPETGLWSTPQFDLNYDLDINPVEPSGLWSSIKDYAGNIGDYAHNLGLGALSGVSPSEYGEHRDYVADLKTKQRTPGTGIWRDDYLRGSAQDLAQRSPLPSPVLNALGHAYQFGDEISKSLQNKRYPDYSLMDAIEEAGRSADINKEGIYNRDLPPEFPIDPISFDPHEGLNFPFRNEPLSKRNTLLKPGEQYMWDQGYVSNMPMINPYENPFRDSLYENFNPNLADAIYTGSQEGEFEGDLTPVQEAFDEFVTSKVLGVQIPETIAPRQDRHPEVSASDIRRQQEEAQRQEQQKEAQRQEQQREAQREAQRQDEERASIREQALQNARIERMAQEAKAQRQSDARQEEESLHQLNQQMLERMRNQSLMERLNRGSAPGQYLYDI
tara:strand:+ start:768 stop:2021 length:1254 start_codon:yes stop_codon:yes gene_type:complete